MEIVEIPAVVLFDLMLKKLSLPSPAYQTYKAAEETLAAEVTFFPSADCFGLTSAAVTVGGASMKNEEDTRNSAARQAIAYMEDCQGKILKDYSYDRIVSPALAESHRINQLTQNNRKQGQIIKEKDQKIREIGKYYDDFVLNVSSTNDKINQLAESGYLMGPSRMENDINLALSEIQKGAAHIDQLTFESTDMLLGLIKSASNTGPERGDGKQLSIIPTSSPSVAMQISADGNILYDSDGRCGMDYLSI